jgi:hypothetical protein
MVGKMRLEYFFAPAKNIFFPVLRGSKVFLI